MPKVPCYEIIDAIRNGNGDMRSIRSSLAWNRSERKQTPGKFLGFLVDVEKRDGLQHLQTGAGGIRVTRA